MFENALNSIFTLLMLICVGIFLKTRKWFGMQGGTAFSKFALNVAIPVNLITTMVNSFDGKDDLLKVISQIFIPTAMIVFSLMAALIVGRIFKVKEGRRGAFAVCSSFANAIFIGLPVVQGIFGDAATPYAMVCYIPNILLFWTIGYYLMMKDGGKEGGFSFKNLKKLFSPPLMGFLIGTAMVLLNLKIPKFLQGPLTQLSRMATPLAMVYIGCVIGNTALKKVLDSKKDLILAIAMRLVVAPMFVCLLCHVFNIDHAVAQIFFVFSVTPTMTQSAMMANECGGDSEFVSMEVCVSTILGLVFIPFYVWLMQYIL